MTRSRDSLGCDGCAGQVGEAGIGGGVLPVLAQWRKAITFAAPKVLSTRRWLCRAKGGGTGIGGGVLPAVGGGASQSQA